MLNLNTKFIKGLFGLFVIFIFVVIGKLFAYDLVFNDKLTYVFDNIFSQYTETRFLNNGNDFAGIIFWQGDEHLINPEPINFSNSTELLTCNYKLKGLYFNSQRGNSLRPLDQESLDLLKSIDDGSYDGVTVNGGLYRDCNSDDYHIYGQVTNTWNNMTYKLVAGVEYSGNNYLQVFDNNAERTGNGLGVGSFRDSWGGIFQSNLVDGTGLVHDFSFNTQKNADLNTYYTSNIITIYGLDEGSNSSIYLGEFNNGILYINGISVGTSGFIENGDKVKIELKSSGNYNEVVSSTLYIGNKSATYYIVTKSENTNKYRLSVSEQLNIILTFKDLVDTYGNDTVKLETFLYTFQSMLEDKIPFSEDEEEKAKLSYLVEVIDSYLEDNINDSNIDDSNIYIAPNCKQYEIEYNEDRQAYYSPDFIYMHYFISEKSLKAYVDTRNLGNGNCDGIFIYNDSDRTTWIAPNGQIYKIEKTNRGYTSYDFINKNSFFDSIEAIRRYIDINNPKIEVRNHKVDNLFTPETYIAPNKKEYEILKTDRGYMSYRFLSVKYFDSLDEIKAYIDKYNPV